MYYLGLFVNKLVGYVWYKKVWMNCEYYKYFYVINWKRMVIEWSFFLYVYFKMKFLERFLFI